MKVDFHRILIVDDDFDEQFLTRRALQKALSNRSSINVASGGDEAIAYMVGEGKFADRQKYPFPSLLFIDLNMESGDGFDVLEFMQGNPGWNVVPKVLLSSSDDDDDVRTAYCLGASVYHLKPMSPVAFEKRMREILEYWASAQIPPVDESGRTLATTSVGRRGIRYVHPEAGLMMQRQLRQSYPSSRVPTDEKQCPNAKRSEGR